MRTYIEVPDRFEWANIFGNVSFAFGDPKVAALSGHVSPPQVVVTSETNRLTSIAEVLGQIEHAETFLRNTDIPAYSQGLVFLFPNRRDYDEAAKALAKPRGLGVSKLDVIAGECAYARIQTSDGQRQAAVLLMYASHRTIDFANAGDRACFVGYFARNLGVSEAIAGTLIFPERRLPVGPCEVVRILRPGEQSPPATRITKGCLPAPGRRAEFISAYAKAGGIGLTGSESSELIRSVQDTCRYQIEHPELRGDDSCRDLLRVGQQTRAAW
jgi:hypothetical protein